MDFRLFDVYYGKGIDLYRKSFVVGLIWQYLLCIFNDDEVNSMMQNIVMLLEERFNVMLRKQCMGVLMKVEIVECLYEELGLNKWEVKELVELFFEEICQVLEYNEQVKLFGFGNFDLCDKCQCFGCNLKIGEEILIMVCCVVIFCLGQKLKVRVEVYVGIKL